jgi:REP-associated tyrosine transposase
MLKKRKANRYKGYDYSKNGFYFVTICTKDRLDYFGEIHADKMILKEYGNIVQQRWLWLQDHFGYVQCDEYVIMPNHFHGILIIDNAGSGRDLTVRDLSLHQKIKSLSELIGAFKTTSSKLIHQSGLKEFRWQRSFHDHIIRNEKSLNNIVQYIINNPSNWEIDENNLIKQEEIERIKSRKMKS